MPGAGLAERVAKLEGRVDGFDARFDSLERRLDALDAKVDRFRAELSGAIAALETKMSSQYRWLLGTQLTVFVTVITVLAGALFVR